MAPALYIPGYPGQAPAVDGESTGIVHGWDDEVIACDNAVRFARLRQCTLHPVAGDHRLNGRIPLLRELFGAFLKARGSAAQQILPRPVPDRPDTGS